jgi:pyruvate formate lyase activating enzyme
LNTLIKARDIGLKAGLRYVYTGNVHGEDSENTFCYRCGKVLIDRWGFQLRKYEIEKGRCRYCDAEIDGVGL